LQNQRTLEANQAMREGNGRGAAKRGPALLAGLLRCGRCGRKLFVAYGGTGGRVPRYACHGGRTDRGHAACLSLGGVTIEEAVVQEVLRALAPAGIDAALAAINQLTENHKEKRRSLELALEKARYEAGRCSRQYNAVDPENRLVAGELEMRWNEALAKVAELEAELDGLDESRIELSETQKTRLLALADDLPALWNQPGAADDLKKRILRTVIYDIVINDVEGTSEHVLVLHWQGGVHTELRVRRNASGRRRITTPQNAIDLIRELSKVCSDQTIAATLNRLGYRTGAGKTWRVHSVYQARYYYRLPNYRNERAYLTIEQAAEELSVSHTVIRRLIKEKILPAAQVVEGTPWIINRHDLALPAVQSAVAAVHQGRQLVCPDPNQGEFPFV
jgi:excisionase family DNA binding protein